MKFSNIVNSAIDNISQAASTQISRQRVPEANERKRQKANNVIDGLFKAVHEAKTGLPDITWLQGGKHEQYMFHKVAGTPEERSIYILHNAIRLIQDFLAGRGPNFINQAYDLILQNSKPSSVKA